MQPMRHWYRAAAVREHIHPQSQKPVMVFAWTVQARNGLVVALAFYVPIVLYRAFTLARLWPVEPATLVLAVLEWLLLIGGAVLWLCLRDGG
jgi:hypothetical protein